MDKITLFWFRQDLRLSDNPGLYEAAREGVIFPVYILDETSPGEFKRGQTSRWWLHHSLEALNKSCGGKLNIYKGNPQEIILDLLEKNHIHQVFWNICYDPWRLKNDAQLKNVLSEYKVAYREFHDSLLWKPQDFDKRPFYKVFKAFYTNRYTKAPEPRRPLPKPEKITFLKDPLNKTTLQDLQLLPKTLWHKKLEPHWEMGEDAAQNKLKAFLEKGLCGYKENRDYPSRNGTSRLSPHLHFGEISPNQVWHEAQITGALIHCEKDLECYLRELIWREYCYYLLYHKTELPLQNIQKKFDAFAWQYNETFLKAWQKGQTGYPLVDAGMRELWQTGYMHNRVRMIVGSFLVKNLRIHWHHGAQWFWDCLVDADLANNSVNWQWVAGSGMDAAPYFRIFNPTLQGEKFDAEGDYTRTFVPELSKLPSRYLFKPWQASKPILEEAGVVLGETYPFPIVSLEETRREALQAYQNLQQTPTKKSL